LYWTVTGARFDAEDACRFGLASRVVPAADLAATAKETVRALSELSPAAVHNAKSVARAMSTAPPDLAVRRSMALKWFL
jgi:enoyl-CoA hydratase/carnithine racemase